MPIVSPPRLLPRLSPEVLNAPEKLLSVGRMTSSPGPSKDALESDGMLFSKISTPALMMVAPL